MAALVATLPLQLVCQLIPTNSPTTDVKAFGKTEKFVLNFPQPPTPTIPTLPEGYVPYPDIGVAYKIHYETVLWKVARNRCTAEGGNLAVIDSIKKFEYVSTQLRSESVTHVGIHSLFDQDEWVSVKTGLPLTRIPWAPGEPNGNSRCAMVKYEKGGLGNFECSQTLGDFICEIPIPEGYKVPEERLENIFGHITAN